MINIMIGLINIYCIFATRLRFVKLYKCKDIGDKILNSFEILQKLTESYYRYYVFRRFSQSRSFSEMSIR